jgi:hypothetical protein
VIDASSIARSKALSCTSCWVALISPIPSDPARLDETDRKLLGLLAEDSTRSYAELGRLLHLSAPAVHERAKRLKQEGVIRATAALLEVGRSDPKATFDGAALTGYLAPFATFETTPSALSVWEQSLPIPTGDQRPRSERPG